ncbi:MAG: DUF2283 domain-containing protein [Elusimicrobia bacterium]|nr:DUF2283 domain-containing protein [Elusimicrobiota bacterium]
MKLSYDRETDVLIVKISNQAVDYAEEMGNVIVHFSKKGKPVFLEILDASEFLSAAMKVGIKSKRKKVVSLRV